MASEPQLLRHRQVPVRGHLGGVTPPGEHRPPLPRQRIAVERRRRQAVHHHPQVGAESPTPLRHGTPRWATRPNLAGTARTATAGIFAPAEPIPDLDQAALAQVCRRYGVAELAVFGSVARGEATDTSDVDST